MMKKSLLVLISLMVVAFLSACGGGGATPPPAPTVFDLKQTKQGNGERFIETTRVDNSTGASDLVQEWQLRRSYEHQIDLRLDSDADLDEDMVAQRIFVKHKINSEQDEEICVIPVDLPAGAIYEYDVEWTPIVIDGQVREGESGGGDVLGTYSVIQSLVCNVISYRVIKSGD